MATSYVTINDDTSIFFFFRELDGVLLFLTLLSVVLLYFI